MASDNSRKRKGGHQSKVWSYFVVDSKDDTKVNCKLCGKNDIKRAGGTTNMRAHIKTRHPTAFAEMVGQERQEKLKDKDDSEGDDDLEQGQGAGSASAASTGRARPSSTDPPRQEATTSFASALGGENADCAGSSGGTLTQSTLSSFKVLDARTTERIHIAVAKFVVTCLLPFRLVEKPGFRRLMQFLKPGYECVKRKALTNTYIPRLYNGLKEKIRAALSHASFIAYTSDMWTSGAGEPYISLTGHFIDKSWKLRHIVLACRQFHLEHTGRNIRDWFEEALKEWQITSKPTSFTTDNGENIRLAVDLLKVPHVRCIGHTIQTGVDDIEKKMPQVKSVTKRTHELRHCLSSDKTFRAYDQFMKKRSSDSEHVLAVEEGDQDRGTLTDSRRKQETPRAARKLPSVSATRWWSEQPLRKIAVEDADFHREFLASYEKGAKFNLTLTEEELCLLRLINTTLNPLLEITQALSGDEYVTACAFLPVVYFLQSQLDAAENLETNDDDPDQYQKQVDEKERVVTMLRSIMLKLKKRYLQDELDPIGYAHDVRSATACYALLAKCSFLDLRFKEQITKDDQQSAKRQLTEETKATAAAQGRGTNESPGVGGPLPKKKFMGLSAIFAKHRRGSDTQTQTSGDSHSSSKTPDELLAIEIAHYECLPALPDDADPLQWWAGQESTLPMLANLARKYLPIPASSVPSERIFSRGGLIVTDHRTCLAGDNVEMLVLTSMNEEYLTY